MIRIALFLGFIIPALLSARNNKPAPAPPSTAVVAPVKAAQKTVPMRGMPVAAQFKPVLEDGSELACSPGDYNCWYVMRMDVDRPAQADVQAETNDLDRM